MEHLFNSEELAGFRDAIRRTRWLGFDHGRTKSYPLAGSLEEYALLRGWSDQQFASLKNDVLSRGLTGLALVQALVWLAPWEAITGLHISQESIIRRVGDEEFIQTTPLRDIIQGLSRKDLGENHVLEKGNMAVTAHKVASDVAFFDEAFRCLTVPPALAETIMELRRQIALSKEMLMEVWGGVHIRDEKTPLFRHLGEFTNHYSIRLEERGWCACLYERLEILSLSALEYFLVMCRSPAPSAGFHSTCCQKVRGFQTSPVPKLQAPLRALHAEAMCQCFPIPIDRGVIEAILKTGAYFLIDIERLLREKKFSPDAVVRYHPGISYIAISHVWSHGLGSTAEEGLPFCCIKRIQCLMQRSSYATNLVWIDSLCIPEIHHLKMASITMMDQIYRNATAVLALDTMLQAHPAQGSSAEELALLIYISEWNSRLWTFQESKLANHLMVAFQDMVISVNDLVDKLKRTMTVRTTAPVTSVAHRVLSDIGLHSRVFYDWFTALRYRLCTVADDEPLVISTLCGLDTAVLVTLAGEKRTAKLWQMIKFVHMGILFAATPKLGLINFRWAPCSLLSGNREMPMNGVSRDNAAEVTSRGLFANLLMLPMPQQATLGLEGSSVALRYGVWEVELFRRDYEWNREQDLRFDAVGFIRDPIEHLEVLVGTPISAIALLWLAPIEGAITRFRYQYQLLGWVRRLDRSVRGAKLPLQSAVIT